MPKSEMLDAALRYSRLGLAVIPLFPKKKKPMFENWVNVGTKDEDIITRWWSSTPRANVGILTGRISNCFVLDVDPKNGGMETYESLISKHGRFPDTWQDMTGGDGGGFHLYFRYPNFEVRNATGIFPGLDIRGDGGQVVAPPSIHPDTGRCYSWDGLKEIEDTPIAEAPIWLLDVLQQKGERTHTDKLPLETIIHAGVRHDTILSLAGALRRLGLTAEEMKPTLHSVNHSRCEKPEPDKSIDRVADSMMKYQPGDDNLFAIATRLWRINKAKECEAKEKKDKLVPTLVDGLTVYRSPASEPNCVIDGLLHNGLTVIAGRPKMGKSYLTLQLALSVALGKRFLDRKDVLRPGGVLYAALEESQRRTSSRMKQFLRSDTPLLENIHMVYDLLPMRGGGLAQLEETISRYQPNTVIIDTFLAFVGAAENRRDVLRADYAEMQALHDLAERHGTAVLVVHHMRKPVVGSSGLDSVAGSTGITAAADCIWTMQRGEDRICSLEIIGRETEEEVLELNFNSDINSFGWVLSGVGANAKDMADEREIMTFLEAEGAVNNNKISSALRMNANHIRKLLNKLVYEGKVHKNRDTYSVSAYARAS